MLEKSLDFVDLQSFESFEKGQPCIGHLGLRFFLRPNGSRRVYIAASPKLASVVSKHPLDRDVAIGAHGARYPEMEPLETETDIESGKPQEPFFGAAAKLQFPSEFIRQTLRSTGTAVDLGSRFAQPTS
jgi:hypothetical protein